MTFCQLKHYLAFVSSGPPPHSKKAGAKEVDDLSLNEIRA